MGMEYKKVEELVANVRGKTKYPDEVGDFELEYLPFEGTIARMRYINGSQILRKHDDAITEVSFTVLGSDLVSNDGVTLPYGANPRFPVLCNTFDNIFHTATEIPNMFVLRNTGLDIFCESAEINEKDGFVVMTFSNGRHGIANGGLTTSVISYCVQHDIDISDVKVSIRVWAGDQYQMDELVEAADARNAHRELELADRLNQLGAFEHMKTCLSDESREAWSFHVGDVDADEDAENAVEISHILYGFTLSQGEGHPTRNTNVPGGVHNSIKKKGRLTQPKTGIESMKQTVGI